VPVGGGGGGGGGLAVNIAPALVAAFIITMHEPVPLHAPLQPEKVEPDAGAALRVTAVPCAKLALHVAPQLIPAGVLVTVPVPAPARVTVSVCWVGGGGGGGAAPNVAVTASAVLTVRVQVDAVPEHAPPQPVNVVPFWPCALSVTTVPDA
jgi:hypothetical protein